MMTTNDIDLATCEVNDLALRLGCSTVACVTYWPDGTCEQVMFPHRMQPFTVALYTRDI